MTIKWYCYVCGSKIDKIFKLVSLNKETDRVFLLCEKSFCQEEVKNKNTLIMKVKQDTK